VQVKKAGELGEQRGQNTGGRGDLSDEAAHNKKSPNRINGKGFFSFMKSFTQ
jgi:hypothetical protein